MRSYDFSRYALHGCVSLAILTGCGGPPPAVIPSGSSSQVLPNQGERSRILPNAKRMDLLYLASTAGGRILSYPEGKLVGSFEPNKSLESSNLCSGANGSVFLTKFNRFVNVLEYEHGGTNPIATLHDPGYPWSCSVDPSTGNLAVATYNGGIDGGNIAVFPNAQGRPNIYRDPNISIYVYCAYDGRGNLFVDGIKGSNRVLAELPKGSATFTDLTLKRRYYGSSVVSWDGRHVTLADPIQRVVLRLKISGSIATVVGTTHLHDWRAGAFKEVSIIGNALITQPDGRADAGVWQYPAGGEPATVFRTFAKGTQVYGVTLSVAR